MHQQPPQTPSCRSTSAAKSGHVVASSGRTTKSVTRAAPRSSPPATSPPRATRTRTPAGRAAAAGRRDRRRAGGAASRSSRRRSARRATRGAAPSRSSAPAARPSPSWQRAASPSASTRTSAIARLRPLAPVGGTMWPASPARYRRPCCIGSTTKLRMPVTPFSRIGPSCSVQPSRPTRRWSSSQMRSSDHAARSSSGRHCRYRRLSSGVRRLRRAKPRSWCA